jgi:hypothetical protein
MDVGALARGLVVVELQAPPVACIAVNDLQLDATGVSAKLARARKVWRCGRWCQRQRQ